MYKLADGWNKEKVMEKIRKYNNGKRCVDSKGFCQYLNENGNRCAIGCFIPDGHPALNSGGSWVGQILRDFPDLKQKMPFEGTGALDKLQCMHDMCPDTISVYEYIERFLNQEVE